MQLKSLEIKHFRSAEQVALADLAGLNVFVGRNNSGKSTMLGAIDGFFEHFREGGIVRLPRTTDDDTMRAPVGAFMRDLDYFAKDIARTLQLVATLTLNQSEARSLLDDLIAESPQVEHAARQSLREDCLLHVRLLAAPPPNPFTYVQRLWITDRDSANDKTLLEIPPEGAQAIAVSLTRARDLHGRASALRTVLARLEPDMFERLKRDNTNSPYFLGLGVPQFSNIELRSEISQAETFGEFTTRIRELASQAESTAEGIETGQLPAAIATFSGTQTTLPRYATKLAATIGQTRVLKLGERRSAIGNQEAQRILDLKLVRGGQEMLRPIQDTVTALLGVSIDAYRGTQQRGRPAPAELDVDDFLVELNGAGIREALRMILDVEFERPDVVLVEEPEVHLHPALETKIREYLKGLCLTKQIFATTHSTNLLDDTDDMAVFLVSKEGPRSNVERISLKDDLLDVLSELGVRPSAIFLYDHLVFVEGPTDEAVIRQWAELVGVDLSQHNVGFVHTSGTRNFRYFAAKSLGMLLERGVTITFIRDRDEATQDEIDRLASTIPTGCHLIVLGRREIENYLLVPTAIAAAIERISGKPVDESGLNENLTAILNDHQATATARHIRHRLLKPVYPDVAEDNPPEVSTIREALHSMRREIDERITRLDGVTEEETVGIGGQWPEASYHLAAGADVLAQLYGQYGLRFTKSRDAKLIASYLTSDEVPGEIAEWLNAIGQPKS